MGCDIYGIWMSVMCVYKVWLGTCGVRYEKKHIEKAQRYENKVRTSLLTPNVTFFSRDQWALGQETEWASLKYFNYKVSNAIILCQPSQLWLKTQSISNYWYHNVRLVCALKAIYREQWNNNYDEVKEIYLDFNSKTTFQRANICVWQFE